MKQHSLLLSTHACIGAATVPGAQPGAELSSAHCTWSFLRAHLWGLEHLQPGAEVLT